MDPSRFSETITPICSTTIDLPPSCIEFVPGHPEFFVVGTYNLQKDVDTGSLPQSRTGSLNLFRIASDELTLIQTLSHPSAILDLHFLLDDTKFGVVSSTGTVSLYNFHASNYQISHLATHQAFDPAILVLSFAWYPAQSTLLLAATLSNGSLHLLQFGSDFNHLTVLNHSEALNSHTLEAWTCAFAVREAGPTRIYSGGDDGKLRLVELESLPTTEHSEVTIVQTIPATAFKGHEAGVTAILPLPIQTVNDSNGLGDLLLTGSYDDHVRVYTTSVGKVLAELKIGGGVWRLKFLDGPNTRNDGEVRFRVLASCMHAGARILELKRGVDGEWSIEVLGSVTVHESMCYGSDVQPVEGLGEDKKSLCVSTSFYDRLVCVWRYDPKTV